MQFTVTIEKLVYGGFGLARIDTGIIFVKAVLPGESALVEITGKKGGISIARPVKILVPSLSRRTPPCPLAGVCGGCDLQHIDHAEQITIKQSIFAECLQRIGHIDHIPDISVESRNEFGYRRRAQIHQDAPGTWGFKARDTNTVINVSHCPLLVDPLNKLLHNLTTREISVPKHFSQLKILAGENNDIASSPVITSHTKKTITIPAGSKKLYVHGDGFFQSNEPLLEPLGTWASPYIGGDFAVDCYGGSGFFSVMLGDQFKSGILIEETDTDCSDAQINFERNGINHFRAIQGRAEELAKITKGKKINCLIVDPPRTGLSNKMRESIALVQPEKVLYISCDPSTQARDAGFLINKAGYSIEKAAFFDLYPNTHHMETVLLLTV